MGMTVKILWTLLFVGFLFGVVALATWGIPAPTAEVTKILPNELFFKKK